MWPSDHLLSPAVSLVFLVLVLPRWNGRKLETLSWLLPGGFTNAFVRALGHRGTEYGLDGVPDSRVANVTVAVVLERC